MADNQLSVEAKIGCARHGGTLLDIRCGRLWLGELGIIDDEGKTVAADLWQQKRRHSSFSGDVTANRMA